MAGQCAFTCSGDESVLDSEDVDDDGQYHCPRTVDNHDHCVFHRSVDDREPGAAADALQRALRENRSTRGSDDSLEFVGATFDYIDLSYHRVSGSSIAPVDLRLATVRGDVTCDGAVFDRSLRFGEATVSGDVSVKHSRFNAPVFFRNVSIEGALKISRTTFHEQANFDDVDIDGTLQARQTMFHREAVFNGASVGEIKAPRIQFSDDAYFRSISVRGHAWFEAATFAGMATIGPGATVEEVCRFGSASVTGELTVDVDTPHLVFDSAVITGSVDVSPDCDCRCDFKGADVQSGTLETNGTDTVYDFTEATVGDVSLAPGEDQPFSHARILDTEFDGFQFHHRNYHDSLAANDWVLHDDQSLTEGDPSLGRLETTYLRAKNGADRVGDDDAAAGFFRKQMQYRRRRHGALVRNASRAAQRLRAATAWLANFAFGAVAGHGERPSRVVFTSLTVVGIFTILFATTMSGAPPYDHPGGYLVVSIESFVTLVLGGAAAVRDPWWVRLLAEIEGFLGVFLVALFVFTLTQSASR